MGDTGSLRKCTIAGVAYRVIADADLSQTPTSYENSTIATSGNAVIKQEKRTEDARDLILFTSPDEIKTLKRVQDEGVAVSLSYQESNKTSWRSTGTINIETRTTMENRTTVSLLPNGEWVTG